MRLIGFGDSIPAGLNKIGNDRITVDSFVKIIATVIGVEYINASHHGCGNMTICSQIHAFEFQKGDIALISWSGVLRQWKWNTTTNFFQVTPAPEQRTNLSPEEAVFMTEFAIRASRDFLRSNHIPFRMISGFQDYLCYKDLGFKIIDDFPEWIEWGQPNNSVMDIAQQNWLKPNTYLNIHTNMHTNKLNPFFCHIHYEQNEFIECCKHPNAKGHKLIAKTLLPYIQNITFTKKETRYES